MTPHYQTAFVTRRLRAALEAQSTLTGLRESIIRLVADLEPDSDEGPDTIRSPMSGTPDSAPAISVDDPDGGA